MNVSKLCVPGTHVTSKRKDQFKKPKIPTPIRKVILPNNNNKIYTLRRLGYPESDCKKALKLSKNDLFSSKFFSIS